MIKLFWNTHNQIPSTNNDTENARNYKWGLYHKNSSNKWIYELLSSVNFRTIKSDKDISNKDILIVIDSSIENKAQFYSRLKSICSKIFLIHLGDEAGIREVEDIYNNCDYIWRTFCSNRYFDNKKISCIPLGYKSGLTYKKNLSKRKYKWAFIGTPHKSSRHDLLFQLSQITPSFSYKTKKFDEKIIEINEMSEILSSTDFIPCPNGFVHPESYRLYEALECECIPIVENTYHYYDRLFPKNPFPKIDKWIEAKSIINEWSKNEIENKRQECKTWWNSFKKNLKEKINRKICE